MTFSFDSFSGSSFSGLPIVQLYTSTTVGASGAAVLTWPNYDLPITTATRAGASGTALLFGDFEGATTRAGASGAAVLTWPDYSLALETNSQAGASGGGAPLSYSVPISASGLSGALGFASFSTSRLSLRTTSRAGAFGYAALSNPNYALALDAATRVGASGGAQLAGPTLLPIHATTRVGASGSLAVPYQTWNPIPVFPELPVGFPLTVKPTFANVAGGISSGRDIRGAQQQLPVWEFELNFETLREQTQNQQPFAQFAGIDEFLALSQLFIASIGQYGRFLFDASWDDSRVDQLIANGDGTSVAFTVVRTWGYGGLQFTEPVGYVGTVTNVKINGFTQDPTTYSIINGNVLTFTTPPVSGGSISMTFTFYYLCQFATDQHDYSEFLKDRWSAKIPFQSIVGGLAGSIAANTSPVFPPPPPPPPPPQVAPIGSAYSLVISNQAIIALTGAVSAGSLIIIVVSTSNGYAPSVSDTVGNIYHQAVISQYTSVGGPDGIGAIFYAYNSIELLAGDSITASYGGPAGGWVVQATGLWVSNMLTTDPHDATVDNTSTVNYPSFAVDDTVTAASAPEVSSSLMVGFVRCYIDGVQNTGYGPPKISGSEWILFPEVQGRPDGAPANVVFMNAGYQFTSSSDSITGTWQERTLWALGITAFKP